VTNHDDAGDRARRLLLVDELLSTSVDVTGADAPGTLPPPSQQPAFAAALEARRRAAHRGHWVRALLIVATLALAGFALVSWLSRPGTSDGPRRDQEQGPGEPATHDDPAYLVRTRPLRGAQRVPVGSALVTVSTPPGRDIATVTRRAAFARVSTSTPAPRLDDEQLLEAFAGQPLALIERAPGRKELVFLSSVAP
jgi:hypothetical protein